MIRLAFPGRRNCGILRRLQGRHRLRMRQNTFLTQRQLCPPIGGTDAYFARGPTLPPAGATESGKTRRAIPPTLAATSVRDFLQLRREYLIFLEAPTVISVLSWNLAYGSQADSSIARLISASESFRGPRKL